MAEKVKMGFDNYAYGQLKKGMAATGLTASAFVRMLILEKRMVPDPPAKFYKLHSEIRKCSEAVEIFLKEIDSGTATIEKLEVVVGMIDAVEAKLERYAKNMLVYLGKERSFKERRRHMAEHRVEAKISDIELENLDELAKKMGTNRSDVIRKLLSNTRFHEKTSEELYAFLDELSAVRFNISDLIHRIDEDSETQKFLCKVVDDINKVHDDLVEEYLL